MSLETIALRAFAEPKSARRSRSAKKPGKPRKPAKPRHVLIFDAETTVDAAQALLFGSYRYVRIRWQGDTPTLSTVEEGLIYADELPETTGPDGFAILQEYRKTTSAALDPAYSHGLPVALKFYSRREFLGEMFYPAVYERPRLGRWLQPALRSLPAGLRLVAGTRHLHGRLLAGRL